ncbi:hypothetical protein [Parafrankia discariae]|uniref:hypothetical protein n=1 Tax=Parafrankia discariae TaxID=365528 RepID=UPI00036EAC11|nr:hypothetical protein [Parafrankia discariae]
MRRNGRTAGADSISDDHLLQLTLRGASGTGRGAFNNYDAFLIAHNGVLADSAAGRMLTAHESLHVGLNDCTAFGVALYLYGALTHARPAEHRAALQQLVRACRDTHEGYATFQSLWLVGGGDMQLLAGYPRYRAWYLKASDILPVADHSRLKEFALDAAARCSMQSGVLAPLLERGFRNPPPLANDAGYAPDLRMAVLRERVESTRRGHLLAELDERMSGLSGWDLLVSAATDPGLREETFAPDHEREWARIIERLYAWFSDMLAAVGSPSLSYDGHQELTAPAVATLEAYAPEVAGAFRPATDDMPTENLVYPVFGQERLQIRDRPRPAILRRYGDLSPADHAWLASGPGDLSHLFLAVRPAFRLLDQFGFSDDDQAAIRHLGSRNIVTVRTVNARHLDPDGIALVALDDPAQARELIDRQKKNVRTLTNISMASLADRDWRRRWYPVLRRTGVSGLLDLSPFENFMIWRSENIHVSYVSASVTDERGNPCALFAFRLETVEFPFYLPCSVTTADALARFLEQHLPGSTEDPHIVLGDRMLAEASLSHLMSEEFIFDLKAYV